MKYKNSISFFGCYVYRNRYYKTFPFPRTEIAVLYTMSENTQRL